MMYRVMYAKCVRRVRKQLLVRLHDFGPRTVEVNNKERFRATLGALLGIFIMAVLCYFFVASQTILYVIAPMGLLQYCCSLYPLALWRNRAGVKSRTPYNWYYHAGRFYEAC